MGIKGVQSALLITELKENKSLDQNNLMYGEKRMKTGGKRNSMMTDLRSST